MNQLPYRDIDQLTRIFETNGWIVLKLPKHSLQLNPLYSYYADLKESLKRGRAFTAEGLFQKAVVYLSECDKSYFGTRYIEKLSMFLKRGEMGETF